MNDLTHVSKLGITAVTILALSSAPHGVAGTKGAYMNSAGYGRAADAVTFAGAISSVISPAMYYPCAAVNPQSFTCNYKTNAPKGTPLTVFCQSKGAPNYIWSIKSYVTGGATADNPELENRISISPVPCASYTMESQAVFHDDYSGVITVNATATAGAALWVRGLEFLGDVPPQSLEELLANSSLRWDILLVGPFDLNFNTCTALTIPFTTQTGHTNLYFVTDAVAKSSPLTVVCPNDVSFSCGESVVYPVPEIQGACGEVSLTFDPPANALPFGATTVNVSATDEAGNLAACSFQAVREPLLFQGFGRPISGTGGSCSSPLRALSLGSVIPVKFRVACGLNLYPSGTPTLSILECPSGDPVGGGDFQRVANEWHFNWDTTGLSLGTYRLLTTLQDGSTKEAYVRLK